MATATLSKKVLHKLLKDHPDWSCSKDGTKLTITLSFNEHSTALVFLMRATVQAEVLNHHPDILFTFKRLKITTTTHDVQGLTKLDADLVKRIDRLRTLVGE